MGPCQRQQAVVIPFMQAATYATSGISLFLMPPVHDSIPTRAKKKAIVCKGFFSLVIQQIKIKNKGQVNNMI